MGTKEGAHATLFVTGPVIGGIPMVALQLHKLGKSDLTALNAQTARHARTRHFPDGDVQAIIVAQDGHFAIVQTSSGSGLLWSFDANTVDRHLQDYHLIEAPDHLRVVFRDFSALRVAVHLNDTERMLWQQKLAPT
jgi:hypothetical protein